MPLTASVDSEAVERVLKAMQEKIANPTDLLQAAVLIVERESKARTPVDTGLLRRSITTRMLSRTSGQVGTNIEYARFVHDGTRYMAARPFLTQGLDASRPTIDELVDRWGDEVVGG